MKFSNDIKHDRSDLESDIYNIYFTLHSKYKLPESLNENVKQSCNLNSNEEYYLIQNNKKKFLQMKSVSSQQNKKIHNINKIIKGKNFSNLLNQYINYSIYKKNTIKTKNNKIEENKENKVYYYKNGQKQLYMEHLIKEGLMIDIKKLKKNKKKTLKEQLTQKKKNILNNLGIIYESANSSGEIYNNNNKNINEVHNNYFNIYNEENNFKYFETINNFDSINKQKIKYYSPNHNNNPNINKYLNKKEITSGKVTKKPKKPKINQFEYIYKIKKEINKIKTEPNNYLSVQENRPKSINSNKIISPKLTKTLNDSFRSNKKLKKNMYSNKTYNERKVQKINLKKVRKQLINLTIKTKDELPFSKKQNHRSPEELHYYIKNKKIIRKKNEVKIKEKAYKNLLHKFKNLYTLNNNFSPNNTLKGKLRKQCYYSPNSYNTISILGTDFKSSNKKTKSNNNIKVLLGDEPKKNLNSTLLDANEYYLNILESQKMIRNKIYNKTEFNFYKNKFQNEERKNEEKEKNINNNLKMNKMNQFDNKDIIKKITKKIIDTLIKMKNVFIDEKNINSIKENNNNIRNGKSNNKNLLNDQDNIYDKEEIQNKEPLKLTEEHNNRIQYSYVFENNNKEKEIELDNKEDKIKTKKIVESLNINDIKNKKEKEEIISGKNGLLNKEEEKKLDSDENNIKDENFMIEKITIKNYKENNKENNGLYLSNIKKDETKEIVINKVTNIINIISISIKRYSFKKLYKYYIKVVLIENYFIGIKYIISICKKNAFMKLKRNLYNDKIFKALKNLIIPFRKKDLKEFFIKLTKIEKNKRDLVDNSKEEEKNKKINNINKIRYLSDALLLEKNYKYEGEENDDSLSELYKNCPNTIYNKEKDNIFNNSCEKTIRMVDVENQDNINNCKEKENKVKNSITEARKESKYNLNELTIDMFTEEILQNIIFSEIKSRDSNLIPNKKYKYKTKLKISKNGSSSNSTDNIINGSNLLDLSNLSKLSSLNDDNLTALNDSIMEAYTQKSYFFKTVIDKRKLYLINFYQRKVAPKLIEMIKKEIILKYDRIYKNISQPYINNSKELMVSLILQDAEMLKDNFKIPNYNESISDIINKEDLLKQFEPINLKIRNQLEKYKNKKNNKINELTENNLQYDQYMNKCLIDCAIELLNNERKYGENGNPLIWSSRTRELNFKYSEKDPTKLVNFVSKNIFKFLKQKNGLICDNYENIPGEIISSEREKRLIATIRKELDEGDYLWRNLEMEETQLKVEISDCIIEQLYNEVIEIFEHIQLSRNRGELYHYKSIYACDEMPKLSFQQTTNTENGENDDNNILFNEI